MNVNFGMPEVLILSSASLFCFGLTVPAWIFFSLGILGTFVRLSLELQQRTVEVEKQKEVMENLENFSSSVINFASLLGKKNDSRMH